MFDAAGTPRASEPRPTSGDPTLAAALRERLVALDAQRCAVEAELLATLGQFAAAGGHEIDGAGSPGSWVAHHLEWSPAGARAVARTAKDLAWMPHAADALGTGLLSPAKVTALAQAGRQVPDPVYAEAEPTLIDQIAPLSVRDAVTVLRFWVARVQLEHDRYADPGEHRRLHVSSTFAGNVELSGHLDPERGLVVCRELDRLIEQQRVAEAGTDGEPIPVFQRRADALVEMASRSMRADDRPDALPPVPLLTAVVDLVPLLGDTDGIVGELTPGTPLPAEAARRLLCDAGVARIVTAGSSTPSDLGRTSYAPSRAQRRALASRDRGCVFPGCDHPPSRTHAHHLVHWTRGGATDMANLCLLCSRHHHLVHEGGWHLARLPDGRLEIRRPDRTLLLGSRPPPPTGWWSGRAA